MSHESRLDISLGSYLKLFLAVFILYLVYLARNIALWFFFGLAISVLLDPAILFLRRLKIPKIVAIIFVYFSIFGLLALLVYLSAPIFMQELKQFTHYLPDYFNQLNPYLKSVGINIADSFNEFVSVLVNSLQESSGGLVKSLVTFFGGISATAVMLAIAFFLSLEDQGPERFLALVVPRRYEEQVVYLFDRAQEKVAGWFGARILACLFVGVASLVVFYMFSVKYMFTLALIAGVLNFIPFIGPTITSLLLLLVVGVSSSWLTALYVLVALTVVQEIENKLLTPLLMKKIIDIPPVVVLVALLVGTEVFGFLGAIFSVPVFGILYEFIREFLQKRKEEPNAD